MSTPTTTDLLVPVAQLLTCDLRMLRHGRPTPLRGSRHGLQVRVDLRAAMTYRMTANSDGWTKLLPAETRARIEAAGRFDGVASQGTEWFRPSSTRGRALVMDSRDDNPPDNSGDLVLDLGERVPAMVMVRRWATDALADLSDEVLGDVLLVVTELVTNAYDHGQFAREVRLLRIPEPCSVRIEVDDSSPEQPVLGHSRIDRHRGRGLVIVDRLSKEWGVIPNIVGKTVWAEVSCGTC